MASVVVRFRARFRWWARPLLHLAVLACSLRLVEFVRDHGIRVSLER